MNRPLVLVVDDDPDILDAICDILDAEGYRKVVESEEKKHS
jgi:DNA-binding response OmpR family regulator